MFAPSAKSAFGKRIGCGLALAPGHHTLSVVALINSQSIALNQSHVRQVARMTTQFKILLTSLSTARKAWVVILIGMIVLTITHFTSINSDLVEDVMIILAIAAGVYRVPNDKASENDKR